jgi:hypothetical protein
MANNTPWGNSEKVEVTIDDMGSVYSCDHSHAQAYTILPKCI